ncbi:MAG: biotin/lipoyl-binding protein, partial [Candidatus Berkelbacteria bacterium]
MKNKKFWVILLIILVVILAATIYLILKNKKGAVSYVTEDVSRGTVVSSISASGSVVSSNYYSIITQASGVVEVVYVKDGDKVSVGQKLLSISLDQDGQQAQAEAYATYLKAQSSLQSAQDNKLTLQSSLDQTVYTRQKNLDSAKTALKQAALDEKTATSTAQKVIKKAAIVAAQKALDFAQSQYNANTDVTVAQSKLDDADNAISQAQINLQAAKIAYQQTQSIVTSPINGVVSGTSCYVGMSITQSSTSNSSNAKSTSGQLLAISNQSNPVINVSVSESDIA